MGLGRIEPANTLTSDISLHNRGNSVLFLTAAWQTHPDLGTEKGSEAAFWEAEPGDSRVQTQPGKCSHLASSCLKINKCWAVGGAPGEVLNLIPGTAVEDAPIPASW